MQNTKFQTYRNYIALDWSKDIAAVASMRDSASSPVKKLLPADIRSLIAYLKSFKGSKILAVEETSTSHWLYVELFDFMPLLVLARINNISDPDINFPAGETNSLPLSIALINTNNNFSFPQSYPPSLQFQKLIPLLRRELCGIINLLIVINMKNTFFPQFIKPCT